MVIKSGAVENSEIETQLGSCTSGQRSVLLMKRGTKGKEVKEFGSTRGNRAS